MSAWQVLQVSEPIYVIPAEEGGLDGGKLVGRVSLLTTCARLGDVGANRNSAVKRTRKALDFRDISASFEIWGFVRVRSKSEACSKSEIVRDSTTLSCSILNTLWLEQLPDSKHVRKGIDAPSRTLLIFAL